MLLLSSSTQRILSKIALLTTTVITLNLLTNIPAHACKAAPGSEQTTIANRIEQTSHVFEGTVVGVNQDKLTIRVKRYFKGKGPRNIILSGFNRTSCEDIINQTGGRYLFFAQPQSKKNWSAVYDGAFGSVKQWNQETEAELRKLRLIKK